MLVCWDCTGLMNESKTAAKFEEVTGLPLFKHADWRNAVERELAPSWNSTWLYVMLQSWHVAFCENPGSHTEASWNLKHNMMLDGPPRPKHDPYWRVAISIFEEFTSHNSNHIVFNCKARRIQIRLWPTSWPVFDSRGHWQEWCYISSPNGHLTLWVIVLHAVFSILHLSHWDI